MIHIKASNRTRGVATTIVDGITMICEKHFTVPDNCNSSKYIKSLTMHIVTFPNVKVTVVPYTVKRFYKDHKGERTINRFRVIWTVDITSHPSDFLTIVRRFDNDLHKWEALLRAHVRREITESKISKYSGQLGVDVTDTILIP